MISDARLQALGLSGHTVLLLGPMIRALLTVLVISLCARQLLICAEIARTTIISRHMGDFDIFYRSSSGVARGAGNPYELVAPAGGADASGAPNLNPPHVILSLVPLTLFEPGTAFTVWAIASLISALFALRVIFKEIHLALTPTSVAWTVLVLVYAAPTGALLFSAQISWLLWGPVTLAWAAARHGRWKRAALLLGGTMSVKPFLGLLLLLLAVKRRWAALLMAATTAVVCFTVGIVALGWPTFASWVRAIGSVTWAGHIFNASLFGFLSRIITNRPLAGWSLAPLTSAPALLAPVWIFGTSSILVLSAWAMYCRHPSGAETVGQSMFTVDRMFAVTLAAALLISPLAWIYYPFFMAGPFLALCSDERWRKALGRRKLLLVAANICFMLGPRTLANAQPNGWATLSIGSAYFWGLLGFWVCALTPPPS